jgi:ferredoxin/NAD-dependent dihydropyrimidine dehydrogenase PreA subunit
MENVTLTINGRTVSVPAGTTILAAAKIAGVRIPTLCAYEGMGPHAACRLCAVKIAGEDKEKLACATKAAEGMDVTTDSPELFDERRAALTEMFRQHTVDCHHCARVGGSRIEDIDPKICENCFFCDCVRDGFCELQALAREFGISELPFDIHEYDFPVDDSTDVIIRNPNKCVKCRRCADVCKNTQAVGVLGMVKMEKGQVVGVTTAANLAESACIRCGRCVDVCPTGAVYMREHKDDIVYFGHAYDTATAVLLDGSVLPELGRLYGAGEGSLKLGSVVTALKKLGIDKVYDAAEAEDFAAGEAAGKLARRRKKAPAILTNDPAAKTFLERSFPELKDDFVFYDSAQTVFAKALDKDPAMRFVVSAQNSLADEAKRTGAAAIFYNARELFRILKRTGADPTRRGETAPDSMGLEEGENPYAPLFAGFGWTVGGEAEELKLEVNGKTVNALICRNPAQARKALSGDVSAYDVIRVIA